MGAVGNGNSYDFEARFFRESTVGGKVYAIKWSFEHADGSTTS